MKYTLLAGIAALFLMMPFATHADFNRVCRGGNLPRYEKEIKAALKQRLTEQGIEFRGVIVKLHDIERSRDRWINDFAPDFAIEGSSPWVRFTGEFPELISCTINARLAITVVYQGGLKATTVTPVSIPGTMLYPLRRSYAKDSTAGD